MNRHRGAICRVERILIHIYASSYVIFHVLMSLLQSVIGLITIINCIEWELGNGINIALK